MPVAPAIVNNTPLVALFVLGRLDLLRDLFGEVLIPLAVESEFLAMDQMQRQEALDTAPWIKPVPLANPQRVLVFVGLDEGEAEVLALAEERSGLVVMDERKGRAYAKRLGFPLTGTLGLLLLAKERNLLDSVATAIEELRAAGLWLSPAVVAEALRLANE